MLEVVSAQELIEASNLFTKRNAHDIWDYISSKDFAKDARLKDLNGRTDHVHPANKIAPYLATCIRKVKDGEQINPLIHLAQKVDEMVSIKMKYLLLYGKIYINENNGFMFPSVDHEIEDTTECNGFPQFKKSDIKISKWEGGKHYYPTLNGHTISVNGREKWNTEQEAMEAATKWLGLNNE
jgi:hypothetical protein